MCAATQTIQRAIGGMRGGVAGKQTSVHSSFRYSCVLCRYPPVLHCGALCCSVLHLLLCLHAHTLSTSLFLTRAGALLLFPLVWSHPPMFLVWTLFNTQIMARRRQTKQYCIGMIILIYMLSNRDTSFICVMQLLDCMSCLI